MIDRRTLLAAGLALPALAVRPALASPDRNEVLRDPDAPVLGNPDGDVTIVEYFDYRCPVCRKGFPGLMDVVAADGHVRLVLKDWPIFGGPSVTAAQAALGAVELGRYPDAVKTLIAARLDSEDDVLAALDGAGIDTGKLTAAINRRIDRINGLLDRNYRQADGFDFNGTPSYVIETAIFRGQIDEKTLKHLIATAREAGAAGPRKT